MMPKDRLILACVFRCASTLSFYTLVLLCLLSGSAPLWAQQRWNPALAHSAKTVVSDVIIRGNRRTPTEHIRARLRTRPGNTYDPEVVSEDIRRLHRMGRFGQVSASTAPDPDKPNRIHVYFNVKDYPSTVQRIIYKGNKHLSEEKLREITGIRVGAPLNPLSNRMACGKIANAYQEQGRPFAHCELAKGGKRGDSEVIFHITEGPKVRIRSIRFTGNTFVSEALLSARIRSGKYIPGVGDVFSKGTYRAPLTEFDLLELLKYYRSFGYHDVRITLEKQWSSDGRFVDLIYHIQEGLRYRIKDAPQVVGARAVPREALEAMSKVKPGEHYKESVVRTDVKNITNYYGYDGRQVSVEAIPVFSKDEPGVMTVRYEVEEAPRARVGQIRIIGNTRTRQNVILRQLRLYPGQILTYPDLLESERRLARLGIFRSSPDGAVRPKVQIVDNPYAPNSEFKDIEVVVEEDNTGSLLFGLGVTSDSGLTGSVVLNERNFDLFRPPTSLEDLLSGSAFRGAGQEFRLELVPGTQLQRYSVTFREPFLFDSPYSLTTSGYYYTRFFNEYTERRFGGRFTLGRKINDLWSVRGTMRVENVEVRDVPSFAPQDYLDVVGDNFQLGLNAGVIYDSRDSFLRPTEGTRVELSYEEVLGDRTFPLVNLDASTYFPITERADGSGRQVLALHSQVGWAGTNTPVYERYFAGGFRTLRGFQFRGVGPEVNGFKTGGTFMLLNSIEYQIPITATDQAFVVGFVDSGTVSDRIDDIKNYRVSAGFGFRFIVPIFGPVPIAMDFGFPIAKGPFDDEQIFNFWLGFYR